MSSDTKTNIFFFFLFSSNLAVSVLLSVHIERLSATVQDFSCFSCLFFIFVLLTHLETFSGIQYADFPF